MTTAIEWTDETWNPIVGCKRVGPGCDHCYAIGVVHRKMSPQHVGLTVKPDGAPTDWTGEVREVPHLLDQPLRWKRPRRIFVNSLSDLFHADLDAEYICKVFTVMREASQHTFQVLTKRPQRMAEIVGRMAWRTPTTEERAEGVSGLQAYLYAGTAAENQAHCGGVPPLPNVWLGTSIETDRYTFRADHLRATPAAVRFVSAEPLLGSLPSLDLTGIDWLIAGGESGPGARPMHPDWVRDLRDRCEAAEVAFLFKQWGAWVPAKNGDEPGKRFWFEDCPPGALFSAPTAIMRRVSKKEAGRELDGCTHDGYPS